MVTSATKRARNLPGVLLLELVLAELLLLLLLLTLLLVAGLPGVLAGVPLFT
jgi:hypothetical protein